MSNYIAMIPVPLIAATVIRWEIKKVLTHFRNRDIYQPVRMSTAAVQPRQPMVTRQKLVDATLRLMLHQGFAATTVDQICAAAGLTKGSFFHYFESKEAIGHAAVDAFAAFGTDLYSAAWKDPELDPLEQLHRIFEIMIGFNRRDEPCVCMVGMMSQEMALKYPAMREACAKHLTDWAKMVMRMLTAAKKIHRPVVDFDPEQVAWFLNSLWQGSMLIGKTRQTPEMVIENIRQARIYVDGLFGLTSSNRPIRKATPSTPTKK
jgi:TetR/AcrR family transcriptional regulator, transcriptional repressor for nem operon